MFGLFAAKPEHPLFNLDEAKRLLAELPRDEPARAMEEVTFWLESLREAKGFRPETRMAIILLLDQTALPWQAALVQHYVAVPHLQDFKGQLQWQGLYGYAQALAAAYAASVAELRPVIPESPERKEQLALYAVRWLRALAEQLKLALMRYRDVEPLLWQRLAEAQRLIEQEGLAEEMVLAYPGNMIHTSPEREWLRALLLHVAAPDELAPGHIEVSYRITGRMASFFDLKTEPDPACPWCFDLEHPAPPRRAQGALPGARYFGAVRALPALERIEKQNEEDPIWQERRFGSEFTPSGKLTVLRHLMRWWSADPPVHHHELHRIQAEVEVVHGFRLICQLVTRIEVAQEDLAAAANADRLGLAAEAPLDYRSEFWKVVDIAPDEIGVELGRSTETWIKIGDLCGMRTPNNPLWWVGVVRRAHVEGEKVHLALAILAKKPLSVWLRALGKGAEKASNWETSSGSFRYNYLPVILLPDARNSFAHATMLMEAGSFVAGTLYQAMMGEKSHDIRLVALLAEGEDYEQVGFEWLAAGKAGH